MARWVALPGIGEWTAHYMAMRALSHPDAFPAADLILRRAAAGDGDRAEHAGADRAGRSVATVARVCGDAPVAQQPATPRHRSRRQATGGDHAMTTTTVYFDEMATARSARCGWWRMRDGLRQIWFERERHPKPSRRTGCAATRTALRDARGSNWRNISPARGTRSTCRCTRSARRSSARCGRRWRAFPTASTISYGELARRIGKPQAVRAVGAANGRNPLPIVLPCHRVIGANGSLTGFGGGLPTKRWLLALEGALSSDLFA